MKFQGHRKPSRHNGSTPDSWLSYECGHCKTLVSGAVIASSEGILWLQCPNCGDGSVRDHAGRVHPGVLYGPQIGGLPKDVEEAYAEARRCMSVAAFTAAELMCRKILMYVAVQKGASEGESFASYLGYLESQGYITPPMSGWVDLIRQHGNVATHSLEAPDLKRAEGTVMFTAELLRVVYEMEYLAKQYVTDGGT